MKKNLKKHRFRPEFDTLEERATPAGDYTYWLGTDANNPTDWYTSDNWTMGVPTRDPNNGVAVFTAAHNNPCTCPGTEGDGEAEPTGIIMQLGYTTTLSMTGTVKVNGKI